MIVKGADRLGAGPLHIYDRAMEIRDWARDAAETVVSATDADLIAEVHMLLGQASVQAARLRQIDLVMGMRTKEALIAFKKSADRSAAWMIRLTVAIGVLTVVLAAETLFLILRGA